MCARCLSWSLLQAGQPFRRHPAYICVLLSEWDVWVDASSVPLGRLSWQPAYLLQPVWVQLCIDHLKCDSTAFFFFSPLCSGIGSQLDVSLKPNATVWLVSDGIASFPFLNSTALNHAYDDSSLPQISFSSNAKKLQNYRCFVSHISPVYRKSELSSITPGIWYVCGASLNWEKDLQIYFYPSWHTHLQWLLVSFLSSLRVLTDYNKYFFSHYSPCDIGLSLN